MIIYPVFFKISKVQYAQKGLNFKKTGADFSLVGGFNPSEKYWSNWIISPNTGKNKKMFETTCHVDRTLLVLWLLDLVQLCQEFGAKMPPRNPPPATFQTSKGDQTQDTLRWSCLGPNKNQTFDGGNPAPPGMYKTL